VIRAIPDGYRVELVRFNAVGEPYKSEPFFYYKGPGSRGPEWPHRPVGIDVGKCVYGDCLFVSSDASSTLSNEKKERSKQYVDIVKSIDSEYKSMISSIFLCFVD
jgi:hypothetical protein